MTAPNYTTFVAVVKWTPWWLSKQQGLQVNRHFFLCQKMYLNIGNWPQKMLKVADTWLSHAENDHEWELIAKYPNMIMWSLKVLIWQSELWKKKGSYIAVGSSIVTYLVYIQMLFSVTMSEFGFTPGASAKYSKAYTDSYWRRVKAQNFKSSDVSVLICFHLWWHIFLDNLYIMHIIGIVCPTFIY